MKRLRRRYETAGSTFSYFYCGEYGEKSRRPHYHALLFGLRFDDHQLYKKLAQGGCLYTSEKLSLVWGQGFCTVGDLTFESAAYVARYALKKITGPLARNYYQVVDQETGEIHELLPEYVNMSLKRPIGKRWYEEFNRDVYPDDFVVLRAKKMKPPKYYDKLHQLADPQAHQQIKEERVSYAQTHSQDSTSDRLAAREEVTRAKISTLKRSLE